MEFSVAGDSSSSETDVGKFVSKIKSAFMKVLQREQKPTMKTLVIETDFDHEKFGSHVESHMPVDPSSGYGTFDDPIEVNRANEIANYIESGLREAKEKYLRCDVLIPCGLTTKIARDILLMSESEPCGIRGCTVYMNLEEKSSLTKLVNFQCDPSTVSTFEVHLTLQEDTRHWCAVKKVLLSLTGCFKQSIWSSNPKLLCLGYRLEKKKLYRAPC